MSATSLSRFALFADIGGAELDEIISETRIEVRGFRSGEVALNECDVADRMMIVMSGEFSAQVLGVRDGDRVEVCRMHPGSVFGIGALELGQTTYPAMLVSTVESEALFMRLAPIRRWQESGSHLRFLANLFRVVARESFFTWRKLTLLSCYRISDRILMLLRWREQDGNRFSVKLNYAELAVVLGVNRTALYRAVDALVASSQVRVVDGGLRLA